ncbi:MAG: hypothetical protein J5895_03550 [Alphaproteobacteria bacterium]|nr:hypothetical protein [Alphaproteobacteria bacterium]
MILSDFEKSYAALLEAKNAVGGFSQGKIISYYQREFVKLQKTAVDNINLVIELLLAGFDAFFPRDTEEAACLEGFSYSQFFELLEKYPELVESNEAKISLLLLSLKKRGLEGLDLDKIPALDDFIFEKSKQKKRQVRAALAILNEVENAELQKELEPIVKGLSARRVDVKKIYWQLFELRNKADSERRRILDARECLRDVAMENAC